MTRGFSDAERERIREALLSTGRDLFARYGPERTTIGDLTGPAGIADGTFYRFFDSKADLYVAVLEREGEEILPRLIAPLEEEDDPEAAIVAFLTGLMDEMETNPLVRRLLVEHAALATLRDGLTDEELAANREESLSYLLPSVEAWYEAGEVVGPSAETVAGAIRAVTFLALHREDVGEEAYGETRDLVIRAVARGLTPRT